MSQPTDRYIISFAPKSTSMFWKLGALWFGYDASRNAYTKNTLVPGMPKEHHDAAVTTARRSGFNIILTGPFQLTAGMPEELLKTTISLYCQSLSTLQTGPLSIIETAHKLSISAQEISPQVQKLADDIVLEFNAFRLPANPLPEDSPIRAALTPGQLKNLIEWGQPYIFEELKFQIPLTGRLPEKMSGPLKSFLEGRFIECLKTGFEIDNLSLFRLSGTKDPAELVDQFNFENTVSNQEQDNQTAAAPAENMVSL